MLPELLGFRPNDRPGFPKPVHTNGDTEWTPHSVLILTSCNNLHTHCWAYSGNFRFPFPSKCAVLLQPSLFKCSDSLGWPGYIHGTLSSHSAPSLAPPVFSFIRPCVISWVNVSEISSFASKTRSQWAHWKYYMWHRTFPRLVKACKPKQGQLRSWKELLRVSVWLWGTATQPMLPLQIPRLLIEIRDIFNQIKTRRLISKNKELLALSDHDFKEYCKHPYLRIEFLKKIFKSLFKP